MKLKKQLKKKTKTIDKLTDLLWRYEKQLTEKVRKFFRSLSYCQVIGQMSSKDTFGRSFPIRSNHFLERKSGRMDCPGSVGGISEVGANNEFEFRN